MGIVFGVYIDNHTNSHLPLPWCCVCGLNKALLCRFLHRFFFVKYISGKWKFKIIIFIAFFFLVFSVYLFGVWCVWGKFRHKTLVIRVSLEISMLRLALISVFFYHILTFTFIFFFKAENVKIRFCDSIYLINEEEK